MHRVFGTRVSEKLPPATAHLRVARVATLALFVFFGVVLAVWATHIPVVTSRTGVSNTLFGMLLVFSGLGAIAGTQLAGMLNTRFGARTTAAVSGFAMAAVLLGPGLATGPVSLGLAMTGFGVGCGLLDVAMNQQATVVERMYARPLLSSFHACCSASVLGGSVLSSGALALGADMRLTFTLVALAGAGATLWSVRKLPGSAAESAEQRAEGGGRLPVVAALGLVGFVLFMCEGAASNWSALQMIQHLGANKATAALSVTGFAVAMTAGRLAGDRVTSKFGPVAVLRWGSALAAAGIAIVIVSPWIPLTLAGWTLFGLGVSCGVPQVFSAAGKLSAKALSRVFGIGYTGLLAGPAVVGWLAKVMPLNAALTAALVAALVACAGAGVVRRPVLTTR